MTFTVKKRIKVELFVVGMENVNVMTFELKILCLLDEEKKLQL